MNKQHACFFFIFILATSLHAQNKGLYVDIGDGWVIDMSGRSNGLASLTVTASYFTVFGIGASVAYGHHISGDKNRPDNGHNLFIGIDYSIPAKEKFQGFPVNFSFSGGLYASFANETAFAAAKTMFAPAFEWESYIFGNGELLSRFYIVSRFRLYYILGEPRRGDGGPCFIAWLVGSGLRF
jgi:hypothetical protein